MAEFDRQPLDLGEIPEKLRKHVQPDAPTKLKMMAARAMLPAPPRQMVKLLYQLQFAGDAKLADAAADSLAEMPADVLGPAVQSADHGGLLDWIGQTHGQPDAIGPMLLANQHTPDATVVGLAEQADANLADIIATNQVRVLRSPEIIEKLYKNVSVSSATIDALIELAQRNEVTLSGLPGLADALAANPDVFTGGDDEGLDEASFAARLQDESQRVEEQQEKIRRLEEQAENMTRSERERLEEELYGDDDDEDDPQQEDDDSRSRGNKQAELNDMSIPQKIRLATTGTREAIKILVRDQNKLVHMAAIKSPRIKSGDVAKFASNKALPDNVVEYIAGNRDWTRKYDVVKNLVNNPKTPLKDTLKFLKHLRVNDLRDVSRSRDVPHQVSRAANDLMRKRAGR